MSYDFTPALSGAYDRLLEEEDARAERIAKLEAELRVKLRADMLQALMEDPQRPMRICGVIRKSATAAEVFSDQMDAEMTHRLIVLLADAAKGHDVQARADLMLSESAKEYGDYYAADVAEEDA